MFHIREPDKFSPSARWINNPKLQNGIRSKQNMLKGEGHQGIYKPYLTLSPRANPNGIEPMLKIELSLPKLMFGNNVDELQYKDFMPVVTKLQTVLEEMGVVTTLDTLVHAPVAAIHYAKNIPLTDGSTPYHYIQKIKEANVKLSLDVNQTDYRNDGCCYKWHCNAYEVVFYDKLKEFEKGKHSKRKAHALLCDSINEFRKRKKFELLRMEVRLNKRQKMKQLFKTLGIRPDLTFKKLFKLPLLAYKADSDKALLATLILHNPGCGKDLILQMFGLAKLLETVTIRELRAIFSNYNKRSWYRLMNDVRKIKLPIQPQFWAIRACLQKFKTLRLEKCIKTHR